MENSIIETETNILKQVLIILNRNKDLKKSINIIENMLKQREILMFEEKDYLIIT